MKKLMLGCLVSLPLLSFAQSSLGEVVGTIVLKKDYTPLEGVKILTKSNGSVYRDVTGKDGRFRISAIPAGTYSFTAIYFDDTLENILATVPIEGIENMGVIEFYSKKTVTFSKVDVTPPFRLKVRYGEPQVVEIRQADIEHRADKFNPKQFIASLTPGVQLTDDGELVFRGARKGDMVYIMDGVKLADVVGVPSAAIGNMKVYTGGIPAKYGDTTGGVVVMETLSYFDLYRDWERKQ